MAVGRRGSKVGPPGAGLCLRGGAHLQPVPYLGQRCHQFLHHGFAVRRAGDSGSLADDVRRAGVLHRTVFGPDSPDMDDELLRRLSTDAAHQELWLVERDGEAVSAGIVSVVPRTRFAGLWGGATLPEHRHSGLYRALTGARARTALSKGADLLYAECTPFSRPILERAGFVRVTTTTPYVWHRLDDSP